MDGYSLSEAWFDFASKNAEKVECKHTALFLYIVEVFNKRKWPDVVGLPSDFTMGILNIGSYKTYKKIFDDLVGFGFIKVIEQSKNQFTSTKIALAKNTKADTKASLKHIPKQDQSSSSIIKQVNIETIKQLYADKLISVAQLKKLAEETALFYSEITEGEKIPFETFWELYPRSENKKQANEKWLKLKKSEQEIIIEKLPKMFIGKELNFIPHASTFLNQKRWEDEIETPAPQPRPSPHVPPPTYTAADLFQIPKNNPSITTHD
jgi:hypothetical protein